MSETLPITDIAPSMYSSFSCGIDALDEYLKRYAKGNHKKNIGKTYAYIQDDELKGFYTVSMGSAEHSSLRPELIRGLPKYPVPVARIGRLAVDNRCKGKGVGAFLLVDALKRIESASQVIGTFAVVIDAKNDDARAFYMHFGFVSFIDEPLSLVLPISSLRGLF